MQYPAQKPRERSNGFWLSLLALTFIVTPAAASRAGAQDTTALPPRPPVVVPSQRTAAQNAAAAMGRQVSNEEIARAIRNSGLTPAEIRARLQQAGFDPRLADPFFANTSQLSMVTDSSTLAAMGALGFSFEGMERAPSEATSAPTSNLLADSVTTSSRKSSAASRRFGHDVFIARSTSFDPEMSGPVDASYRLGVGDAIQIVFTGQVEQAYQVEVRRDGNVLLQNLGAVPVAGLTLESARSLIRARAARSYSGITEGKTTVDLTVTKLRANQVRVIGEVERPGAYQVSGLSTVFHALARAGGPSERGSFRNIELRRGGAVIQHVDLYDYLIKGDALSDVRTEHGDMIYVPPAMRSVTVVGAMRREGIFELKDGEGFRDLIYYAGGLLPSAATNRIHIDRTLPPEQRRPGVYRVVLDVPLDAKQSELDTLKLQDDDVVTVYEIGDLRRNSVSVNGAINQPGSYEWKDGLTLGQLINRAQGFLPWGLSDRVKVKRQIPSSGRSQFFSLDLRDSTGSRFRLDEFDEVTILDGREVARSDRVKIHGAVRAPGVQPWAEDLTLGDLIDLASGFQPWAMTDRIIVNRTELATGRAIVLRLDARDSSALRTKLQPLDDVSVSDARVANPSYNITISGAVYQPGEKPFGTGMTLADAIDLAGGFRPEARSIEVARLRRSIEYSDTNAVIQRFTLDDRGPEGIALWRTIPLERDDRIMIRTNPGHRDLGSVVVGGAFRFPGVYVIERDGERLSNIVRRAGGPLPIAFEGSLKVTRNGRPVPVDYKSITKGGDDDIVLADGDQVQIDVKSMVVAVGGAVARQVVVPYRPRWALHDYIDAAGGFADSANTSNIVVTYASGAVRRERSYLHLFHSSPKPEPGSTITVGFISGGGTDWSKVLTISAQAALTLSSLFLSYLALTR